MGLSELWEIAKTLGPGGATLCLALWLDERRERRQVQSHVTSLHRENTKRLERILKQTGRIDRVMAAQGSIIAASARTRRRGGR